MLKGPDSDDNKVESMEHCEKFWYWLQDKGISAHRSAIVKAIAMKVNGLLPGVYDPDLYDDDESDEEWDMSFWWYLIEYKWWWDVRRLGGPTKDDVLMIRLYLFSMDARWVYASCEYVKSQSLVNKASHVLSAKQIILQHSVIKA